MSNWVLPRVHTYSLRKLKSRDFTVLNCVEFIRLRITKPLICRCCGSLAAFYAFFRATTNLKVPITPPPPIFFRFVKSLHGIRKNAAKIFAIG